MRPPARVARWLSLVAAIWLQSISGTNSNFPAYSSQLKQALSLTQLQLNNLAFASDAGKLLGWFSGIAASCLPLWLVLLIGTVLGSVGYGVQYLVVGGQITFLSYPHVLLLTVLGGNSICWINTVCYITMIRNFPCHRQVAVGLTTSYQGLSASVYAAVVSVAFNDKVSPPTSTNKLTEGYLLLNSLLPLLISAINAPLLRVINAPDEVNTKNDDAGFVVLFVITIATGIYAVVGSLGSMSTGFSPLHYAIGMGVFLLIPVVIPIAAGITRIRSQQQRVHNDSEVITEAAMTDISGPVEKPVADEQHYCETAGVREEVGVGEMLKRVDFWLYFLVYLFGATLGLVFLNNLGQIAESRGSSRTSSLVALSSSFGFFGRLLPSLMDYLFSRRKYAVARPAVMGVLMAPMVAAFFLLLNPASWCLYASTAVIGICTGAISSISVSITTELFGSKNFGINHNVVIANIPIGSLVFGYLAALLYGQEPHAGDGRCMGMQCYRTTFIIWGCLCTCGTFLASILYARTRSFYSKSHTTGP